MSETVQIILIVAIALIIVLFIFRRQLSNFRFKGGKDGVDMQLKTHKNSTESAKTTSSGNKPASINISGNKLWGRKNKIDVQTNNTSVNDNSVIGDEQEIVARNEVKKKK